MRYFGPPPEDDKDIVRKEDLIPGAAGEPGVQAIFYTQAEYDALTQAEKDDTSVLRLTPVPQ